MQNEQKTLFSDNPEYEAFVEKFKPKKTTDDCYTPPLVYEAVKKWAVSEYGIDPDKIVRPFYPGGDYENFDYSGGKVVLDNPPFSILSKICGFYLDRGIPFFLFAPSLTAFSARSIVMRMNHLICDADIIYDNGAVVRTSFVTSFGGDMVAQTAPELTRRINRAVETIRRKTVRELPKYAYPDNVVTAAMLQRYAKYGIEFSVRREECCFIPKLDAQRESGKAIYGGGLLVNSQKAAERAAAERAAAERAAAKRAVAERAAVKQWRLSERERRMVEAMSVGGWPRANAEPSAERAQKELKGLSDETGMFDHISDEDIKANAGRTFQDVTALRDPLMGLGYADEDDINADTEIAE